MTEDKRQKSEKEMCWNKSAPNIHSEMFENWLPVSQMSDMKRQIIRVEANRKKGSNITHWPERIMRAATGQVIPRMQ